MIMGINSIDQIILGILMGIYCLYVSFHYFDEAVDDLFYMMLNKSFKNKIIKFLELIMAYLLISFIPAFIFLYDDYTHPAVVWETWHAHYRESRVCSEC